MTVCKYCSPDRSYSICGPNLKGVGNDEFYETKSNFGVQIVQVCFVVRVSSFWIFQFCWVYKIVLIPFFI